MEQQILSTNLTTKTLVVGTVSRIKQLIQSIVDEFKTLNIGELSNIDEYVAMKSNPELFIRQRILSKSNNDGKLSGVPISPAKLAEMVELPNGTKAFVLLFENVKSNIEASQKACYNITGINVNDFVISEGIVIPSPELQTLADRAGVVYAEKDQQVAVFNQVKKVITEIEKLNKLMNYEPGTPSYHWFESPFVRYCAEIEKQVPNEYYIIERVQCATTAEII